MRDLPTLASQIAAISAGVLVAGAAAITLWQAHRLGRAWRWAVRSDCVPFETADGDGDLCVLMLGDSTCVGLGAADASDSIAGLVARSPFALGGRPSIVNRSFTGARVADFVHQAEPFASASLRFDLVVIIGGGNDVLRFTRPADVLRDARRLLALTTGIARRVVWLGCPDIGLAPLFLPPFSWLLGRRTRATMQALSAEAARAGVSFVDFSSGAEHAQIVAQRRRFFAPDGVHPSTAAYRHGFDALCDLLRAGKRVAPDLIRLAPAADPAIRPAATSPAAVPPNRASTPHGTLPRRA